MLLYPAIVCLFIVCRCLGFKLRSSSFCEPLYPPNHLPIPGSFFRCKMEVRKTKCHLSYIVIEAKPGSDPNSAASCCHGETSCSREAHVRELCPAWLTRSCIYFLVAVSIHSSCIQYLWCSPTHRAPGSHRVAPEGLVTPGSMLWLDQEGS